MAKYNVLIPFAGHISVIVDADDEKTAIAVAMESEDLHLENVESWEALDKFSEGNVCYCPLPWEATACLAEEP
jgi:hypothetical protein